MADFKMRLRPLPHRIKPRYDGTETRIQDLPIQVLAEIFNYVYIFHRQGLRSVCVSWNYIIGQLFPIALKFGNTKMLTNTDARFIDLTIIGPIRTKFYHGPWFNSVCCRIRKLELVNTVFKTTHLQILRRATNLEDLALYFVSTKQRSPPDLLEKMVKKYEHEVENWLPALKTLSVDEYSCPQVLKLLSRIVKNGKLTSFSTSSKIHPLPGSIEDFNELEPEPDEKSRIAQEIITSNHSTLSHIYGSDTGFHFHPRPIDKTCIYRKFYAFYSWTPWGPSPFSLNWLRVLQEQKNLEKLDMMFSNYDDTDPVAQIPGVAFGMENVEPVVSLTMGVILGNANALTKISLIFIAGSWFRRVSQLKGFDEVFSSCVSLKHLCLHALSSEPHLQAPSIYDLGFRGITTLPKSLEFLDLSFPIVSSAAGLRELDLHNLENLETLVLDPVIWFIFTGTGERIKRLSINHVKQLKSKLPKLKLMSLNVANHGTDERWTGKLTEYKLVTPGLFHKFKKTLGCTFMSGLNLNIKY